MATKRTLKIDELKHDPRNARKHGERNVDTIARGLSELGAGRSILIDGKGEIVAGNGVVEAAKRAGITKVRVVEAAGDELIAVRRSDLKGKRKQRMALLDNRAGELAEWDEGVLAAIAEEERDVLRGLWTEREIAALLADAEQSGAAGEKRISPELMERQDYLVFIFDNELDWRAVCDEFDVGHVYEKDPATVREGAQSANQGTGRVLMGKDLLARLRGDGSSHSDPELPSL